MKSESTIHKIFEIHFTILSSMIKESKHNQAYCKLFGHKGDGAASAEPQVYSDTEKVKAELQANS